MLRLFGLFGRAPGIRRFDREIRGFGLHPALVPDAVKIAAVRMLEQPPAAEAAWPDAAALLAYCMSGRDAFQEANGAAATAAAEGRMEAAIAAGGGRDADLVLLTLHAGVAEPSVVARYGLEAG
ncbi:MAG: hypothetical protein ACK4QW_18225 [Alphaproteobacteria bacterium]